MTRVSTLLCLLALLAALATTAAARGRGKVQTNKPSSRPPKPAVKLNVDVLPPLQDVLEELQMTPYLRNFIRMGVAETRLLLKLSSMDFQIMSMDWESFSKADVARLKEKIAKLMEMATVPEVTERPELEARNKLIYGRVFLQHGVQSMEFALASFGSRTPLGQQTLRASVSGVECEGTPVDVDYAGAVVVAQRGNCSFLTKALSAKARNAAGIVIVNTEDRLDHPSSGLGVDPSVVEATVQTLDQFFVAGMANTSWMPLRAALDFSLHPLSAHFVPIKCQTGGKCLPLLEEERALQAEVAWGRLRVRTAHGRRTFDFLTSTFGAPLPVEVELPALWANPVDACSPLPALQTEGPTLLIAHRGACKFDVKVLHAQQAGARALVMVDVEDQALQRIGALAPNVGLVGIPSVLVTAEAGRFLQTPGPAYAEFVPAADQTGFEHWLEVAYTQWSEAPKDRVMQLQGLIQQFQERDMPDIVSWLHRRVTEAEAIDKKSVETDEL